MREIIKEMINEGPYGKSGIQPHTPEHAKTAKLTTAIIKRTNTRTRTTEKTEHWLSKWVQDYALETYNTVEVYCLQDTTNHHQRSIHNGQAKKDTRTTNITYETNRQTTIKTTNFESTIKTLTYKDG